MNYGFWGRIAHVDLSNNKVEYESPNESFYRKYLGGGGIGSYYINKLVKPGTDPFSPENVMVFAPSVITGAPIPGLSRHSVTSVSPLTGGVSDSEAGGFWASELKFAGLDAIIVKGKAEKPVYLWVKNGDVEIKDASTLWGKYNADVLKTIEDEMGEKRVKLLGIGPGGENLVRYACIIADMHDANGRGGLGAVMGSKKLKAIAVKGSKKIPVKDEKKVLEIAKNFAQNFKDVPGQAGLYAMGTTAAPSYYNSIGGLPTMNWNRGHFETVENISGKVIKDTILAEKTGCYACPVRCKRMVEAKYPYDIDPVYAGIEYESQAALGSYIGIDDLHTVCKAIELCNKNTIDTISLGGTIAFAMECYENGLLTKEDTDDMELKFGNKDVIIPLIEKIIKREGIGDILAEGSKRAAEKIGKGAEKYAVQCKGVEYPAHEPRVKKTLALAYSLCPIGADHMANEHDPSITTNAPKRFLDALATLDLRDTMTWDELGPKKVRYTYYTMIAYSLLNMLDICMFCMAPARTIRYDEVVDIVKAVTGWDASLWELMKAGERRLNMMRVFNVKSGIGADQDKVHVKMYKPLEGGISNGKFIDKDEAEKAIKLYYKMSGWDEEGKPENWKLIELDLDWLI